MTHSEKIKQEFIVIKEALEEASENNVQVEIIHSALKHMKQDPKISISEAIFLGYEDWIK
jgi:predicted RNA methylase